MTQVQTLVFGVITGSYLIVATLGFALISRVDKFLNIAHAEFISACAFLTYYLSVKEGWPLLLASATAVLAVAILAALVGRFVYWPIRRAGSVVLLITSVGVVYVLHGLIEAVIKPGAYSFPLATQPQYDVGLFRIGPYDLVTIGLAAGSVLALNLFLTKTRVGLQLRAMASDEALARSRGIDIQRSSLRLWLAAGALGGLAGVLLGLQGAITTDLSFDQILLILSVSILAGLGSIYGVVVSGLLLGVAMSMSTLIIPAGYQPGIAFAVVILVLFLRPEGLSGSTLVRRD